MRLNEMNKRRMTYRTIDTILWAVAIVGFLIILLGCEREDFRPSWDRDIFAGQRAHQEQVTDELMTWLQSSRPAINSIAKAEIDTNIVDNYYGWGQWPPLIEYNDTTNDVLGLADFKFFGSPFGDLRSAIDTTSGVAYDAWWQEGIFRGQYMYATLFQESADRTGPIYVYFKHQEPTDDAVMIQGQVFIQDISDTPEAEFGNVALYGANGLNGANVDNCQVELNPFIDTEDRIYNGAYFQLDVYAIHNNGDTLKGTVHQFGRMEGVSELITGEGALKGSPLLTDFSIEPIYLLEPTDIDGQVLELFPGYIHNFAMGNFCHDEIPGQAQGQTALARTVIAEGFTQVDIYDNFSKIIYVLNGGPGNLFEQY
jgi:hypothetical protein